MINVKKSFLNYITITQIANTKKQASLRSRKRKFDSHRELNIPCCFRFVMFLAVVEIKTQVGSEKNN